VGFGLSPTVTGMLRMCENRLPRIPVSLEKKVQENGENVKRVALKFIFFIKCLVDQRKIQWRRNVARGRSKKCIQNVRIPYGKRPFGTLVVDGWIILKWVLTGFWIRIAPSGSLL
jgi:hypothetical protein